MLRIETKTIVKIAVAIFALYLAIHYWSAIADFGGGILSAGLPLIIGFVISYPLNILMSFYERHFFPKAKKKFIINSRRGVCLLLAIITLLLVVALVVALVLPQLISTVKLLIDQIPDAITDLLKKLDEYNIVADDIIDRFMAIDWQSKIEQIVKTVTSGLTSAIDVVVNMVSSLVSIITTTVLSIIFAIYLLIGKEKLLSQSRRIMNHFIKEKTMEKINYVLTVIDDSFHRFIVGQCTEAVILGVLVTVGMFIFGLPYAPMIGATMAFTSLIPVVGALIGAGVGVFLILMVSPVKALIFLIFIIILQQLENNLVYPKVVGSSIGLPGLWVLAAVTVGGGVLGVMGMMLGVPLAAASYRLLREYISRNPKTATEAILLKTDETEESPISELENENIKIE